MERTKKVITSARFRTSESSALLNVDNRSRAISVGSRIDEPSARGYLGKVAEQSGGSSILDHSVWIDLAFPHVIGVFGIRGTGKSFDLGVLVECISGAEKIVDAQPPQAATVIFDVQNQFWTLGLTPTVDLPEDRQHVTQLEQWGMAASALPDTQLWLPSGVETALPSVAHFRISPELLQTDDWLALLEIDRYSPIGQALNALISSEGSKAPGELLAAVETTQALSRFQMSTIDALRWRLEALARTDFVGSPGTDIREFLVPGRTSVLLLRDLPDALRALIVGVVVRLLSSRMGAFHQTRRVARRHPGVPMPDGLPERLWVILDEAHVIVPRDGTTAASGPVVDYVKRGRDAGLSLVFATQQPAAVDSRLMSQVDLTLTHALAFDSDLQAAIGRMPTRTSIEYERTGFKLPSLGDTIRALDPGEAVVADSANGRIFLMRIRPRLSAHGGNTPPVGHG